MQRKTKFWLGGGAAVLLTLGGLATLANADMNGAMGIGHGMGMGHGMGHGMGRMAMAQQLMERYDADKDGKVTQAEIDQNRTDWQKEFDADKNGTLSLEEFQNLWLKARHEDMVREFQFFDRDGNAQITLDEYKGPLANIVADRDRNGDGALSREDRPQRGEGWRHRDRDGQGRMGQGMMNGGEPGEGMGQGMGQGMGGHGMMNGNGMGQGMMNESSPDDGGGNPPPQPENP
jgi:Ca2+-binding EF-hand superfamily protein